MFLARAGHHTSEEILEAWPEKSADRFFSEEDEVIHAGDTSYLLSNQWGTRTEEAVRSIVQLLPENHGVEYEALG